MEKLTTDTETVEDALDNLGGPDGADEDGYVALRRVLDGEAGVRNEAAQIPILFSDELGPNVIDNKSEIVRLQNRVKKEAAGFIGIGDTGITSNFPPDIQLEQFTRNVTEQINGEFFESSRLTGTGSNLLAGEIADTVRAAAVPNATGTIVDEGTFRFEI